MSLPSPASRSQNGTAGRTVRAAALVAAAFLIVAGASGGASAQDEEFPGPDSPECSWAGERILSLLWRDDIRTASDYLDLYDRFDCPSEHVPMAFRCLVKVGVSPEQGDPGLPTRARACWGDPALDPASLQPAAPAAEGGGEAGAPQQGAAPQGEGQPAQGQQPAAQ